MRLPISEALTISLETRVHQDSQWQAAVPDPPSMFDHGPLVPAQLTRICHMEECELLLFGCLPKAPSHAVAAI